MTTTVGATAAGSAGDVAAAGVASTLTPAGQRVLAAACDLFYAEGIHAVGVDAIAAAAGVTKKTLYDRFGSKDALVALCLRARDERWRAWLTSYVDTHGSSPRDRILTVFDGLDAWMAEQNPRGCGFVNALAELPAPEHPGRAVIREQKEWLLGYLTSLVKAAGLRRPARVASALMVLQEGATIAHATGVPARPARQAREVAALLLDQAG
ncbi:TetR/AcrR family transcriptional regulator [Actinopolymorpha pittospori]|uniref:AcrR family transcriptional regulator n=1 Tax=Actinopolymorpha pittospori TaxID=648752 RepID=A0A927MXU3_9ACTN|nr:TetR/AcrR family transcriptional regulator [Actinopolymorpha pittospori]MBE1606718.1 AcrR family transcriptional regulator [Actinopolymorpha pittospori]